MSPSKTVLVDYNAGNLTSVQLAVRHVGCDAHVSDRPEDIVAADRVIVPGVGAAGASMEDLQRRGLDEALREFVASGRPMLGICIGCQVIFERSEEDGGTDCLGLLPGEVRRFAFAPGVLRKVPHMGWNEVNFVREHALVRDIPPASQFYFVHSYYPTPTDGDVVLGRSLYGGVDFAVAVARDNLAAVQFHTEKSGPPGLQLLANFLAWSP